MTSPCQSIKALTAEQYKYMNAVNRQYSALHRIAELLALSTSPASLVPDINQLIPLNQLDIQAYEALRIGCPALGLPSGVAGLASLVAAVKRAYDNLILELLNHPWGRLDRLQHMLDRYQAKFTIDQEALLKYLQCVRSICNATVDLPESLRANQEILDTYQQNFVTNGGKVLSAPMRVKRDQVLEMVDTIKAL